MGVRSYWGRGALELSRLHLSEGDVASSQCIPAIVAEIEAVNLYPDPDCEALVSALARQWKVEPENIAVSNGSDELILLCALALGDLSRPGAVSAGTFRGHRFALEVARRGYREVPLVDGRINAQAFSRAIAGAGIAFICSPHNPSGVALSQGELNVIVAAAEADRIPLVADEAYMEFAPGGTASVVGSVVSGARGVALRTFSKAYGLAGMRIGYAVGNETDIAALRDAQRVLPFRVNRLAQAAALAALSDRHCIDRVRAETSSKRQWFTEALRADGFRLQDSATNFVTVAVDDPGEVARVLLEDHAIAVRDTSDMGYPGHVRISLGDKGDLEAVLRALAQTR
jgi:histidinol-phosphate aminotransferase